MTRKTSRFFVPENTPIYVEPDETSASRPLGRDDRLALMRHPEVDETQWRWVFVRPAGMFGNPYTYIKASVPLLPAQYRIRVERLAMYFLFSLAVSPILMGMRIIFPEILWLALGVFVVLSLLSMIVSGSSDRFGFVEWMRPDETRPAFDLRRALLGEGLGLLALLFLIAAVRQLS